MSTKLNTNGEPLPVEKLDKSVKGKFYVIQADWNHEITDSLAEGAKRGLREAGVDENKIKHIHVPGTVELVNIAALYYKRTETAAVIILGCVIRGDTPHFDYVCQIVSQGTAILNAKGYAPVIFGVLTVENLQQALDRAGGVLGNKGEEAASAAVTMANVAVASVDEIDF